MKLPVRIREEAEVDLSDAAIWYEQQRVGLGQTFLDQALSVMASLPENPDQYPVVHNRVRRALLGRFPFGVYNRVGMLPFTIIAQAAYDTEVAESVLAEQLINIRPWGETSAQSGHRA